MKKEQTSERKLKHKPKEYQTKKTIKMLELFGGIGSPRKALQNLGVDVKHIDYVEWWKHPVEAYNRIFDNNYQPQDVRDWNLNVDILCQGSPCQDWSVAGKNDLLSGRSILYLRVLEIIEKELHPRPKVVIWENVKGLISKKNFPHFQHYLDTMESFGYTNYYEVLNSKDFGIPQSRNRVFVVSILKTQTKFNSNFNFANLEKIKTKKLKTFLEPHDKIDKSYYITQKSMSKAIEQGKIKIVDDQVGTILTKQFRWNNQGVVKVSLHDKGFNSTDFVHNPENSNLHTIGSNSANNRIAVPLVEQEFKWDKDGRTKIPTRNFSQYKEVVNENEGVIPTITTNHGETPFKIAVPIFETESKDFSNFKTLPRASDGDLINGAHNRYWKDDKYVGTIAASTDTKILVPLFEVNQDYDYRLSDGSKRPIGKINKEGAITIPITTNHTSNKVGVDIAPTLTTQNHKILVDAINPIEGVPIFIIDGKPYHLRILTQRETWRLMGWDDKSINKVIDMPKTHLYHMAGNAIVIQVLEAIFKELINQN